MDQHDAEDPGGAARDARVASDESENALVHAAVEKFIELHSSGETPDLDVYLQSFPEAMRPRIQDQCREFLAFDGLLGHQPWEPQEQQDEPGRVFGDFVIQEELGRGGMGVVYLARQRSLNRRVALKVMASGLTLSKRHVERFRREAAATAKLRHPAIVPVHSLVEVDGAFAIAMDYIAGRNLADIVDDLRLANGNEPAAIEGTLGVEPDKGYVAECAIVCAQIASALASAHQQGVVHRDLKPRNLMIDDRRQTRLLDFGLSKSLGDGSISMSGEITGTVHYMSPEQTLAKRVPVDHRADVFALGVMLYELLTLKRPFDGKNLQQIVYEICFKEPVSPQRHNPKVPRDLVTICSKALEKDPSNRYQTAAEFEADLVRFLRWEPIHAKPAGPLTRLNKWVHRHRTEVIAGATVFALAAGGLGYAWYGAVKNDREADELVQQADQHDKKGDHRAAFESATQALAKRDDAEIRAKLDAYQSKIETAAKQEEVDIAVAAGLSRASNQAIARDRKLAVVLALHAVDRHADAESRSAVLEALGSGFRTVSLDGHPGRVYCARWSPDGKAIVTAGTDPAAGAQSATAILWRADGTKSFALEGHRHLILDANFHPDGTLVATASIDGTVRLWHTKDGTFAGMWNHRGTVQHVEFDASGARAMTFGYESQQGPYRVQVWDVSKGEVLGTCATHTQFVRTAALSPCGRFVASFGDQTHVKLWSAETGTELAQLTGHKGHVAAIAFRRDGALVAVAGSDGTARIYSVPDGTLRAEARHSREVTAVEFDRSGDRLLTGSADMSARVWHVTSGPDSYSVREEHQFVGHTDTVTSARFDSSGLSVVTGSKDGVVRVFDANSERSSAGVELMRYELGGSMLGDVAFVPGPEANRILAVADRKRPVIWDFADARGVVTLRQPGLNVPAACFNADGSRVATAGDDERLRLWDAHDGRQLWTVKLSNPVDAIDIDQAGERIVASTDGGKVQVLRLSDGEELFALPGHDDDVAVVRFAKDGTRILTASADKKAIVWNANDKTQVAVIQRPHALVTADLSPDGSLLLTVEADESVARLWTVVDGLLASELVHGDTIHCVAFRPDGGAVLTAGNDGIVRISLRDGTLLTAIDTGNPIVHAAWSRDSQRVLTSSQRDQNTVRLWNVADGSEELRFRGHTNTVECNAFSPDGGWAVTASRDGTARIWPTDPVGIARRLNLRELTAAERRNYHLDR